MDLKVCFEQRYPQTPHIQSPRIRFLVKQLRRHVEYRPHKIIAHRSSLMRPKIRNLVSLLNAYNILRFDISMDKSLLMDGVHSPAGIQTNTQKLLELDMSIHFYPVTQRVLAQLEQNVHFFVFLPRVKVSLHVPVDADYERFLYEPALRSYFAVNEVLCARIATIVMHHLERILVLLRALDRVNSSAGPLAYFPKDLVHDLADFYLILEQHVVSL